MDATEVSREDFYAPEVSINPHPLLHRVREAGPAIWHETYQAWLVGRYDDIKAVCRDDVNFTAQDGIVAHNFGRDAMLAHDGATHRRIRSAWNAPFLRSSLERLAPVMGALCDTLLAPVAERLRRGELVDLAPINRALPVEVVRLLLGIPEEYRSDFARWSDEITHMTGYALPADHPVEVRRVEAQKQVADLMRLEITKRRVEMQPDLIGNIVASGLDKELGNEALVDNCRLLLVAGNETTSNWIGNTIYNLARFPAALRDVRNDLALIPQALEEVLRYEGVAHLGFRRAKTEKAYVGDVKIPVGDQLWLIYSSGNRDDAHFDDPDSFDIHRKPGEHLGFGFSFHTCLGQHLARIEGRVHVAAVGAVRANSGFFWCDKMAV